MCKDPFKLLFRMFRMVLFSHGKYDTVDELDWELSGGGLRFVRYTNVCNISVRTRRSGERVMASISRLLEKRLRHSVNVEKSAICVE